MESVRAPERSSQAGTVIDRFQAALARIDALQSRELGDAAHAAIGALLEMYGDGLQRILAALESEHESAGEVQRRLVADEVVASLLLIHDLHPLDLSARVERALERTRGYVKSHGGTIELVGVDHGVARIRMGGTCNGCPSSVSTIDLLLRGALTAEAPDLVDFVVENPAPSARTCATAAIAAAASGTETGHAP